MIDWNAGWKSFLLKQGAVIGDQGVQQFKDSVVPQTALNASTDVIADLSHLATLRVHGADAAAFLQSQLSNDIRLVDDTHSQLSAYCNPQGRIIALFRVYLQAQAYCLLLPATLREATQQRLKKFILRAKISLDNGDSNSVLFGVSGQQATKLLADHIATPPAEVNDCRQHGKILLIRQAGPYPRYLVVASAAAAEDVWMALSPRSRTVGGWVWSWLDIVAGVPTVLPGTVEEFIPQQLNLDRLGAVNFQKGCYPGQEIVARVHHLGRIKQRMFNAHTNSTNRPEPGGRVYLRDSDLTVGRVVDTQPSPEGGFDLSVVLDLEKRSAALVLNNPAGPPLAVQNPPYPLAGF